jgi:hypothetical protein
MPSNVKLPKTPTVVTRDKAVIVCFANGSELDWNVEKTSGAAKRVAKELEIELKAVKYVQWHVKNFIQDMKEYLSSLDIDENLLDSILMNAGSGLRKQVLNKLDFDNFIV